MNNSTKIKDNLIFLANMWIAENIKQPAAMAIESISLLDLSPEQKQTLSDTKALFSVMFDQEYEDFKKTLKLPKIPEQFNLAETDKTAYIFAVSILNAINCGFCPEAINIIIDSDNDDDINERIDLIAFALDNINGIPDVEETFKRHLLSVSACLLDLEEKDYVCINGFSIYSKPDIKEEE